MLKKVLKRIVIFCLVYAFVVWGFYSIVADDWKQITRHIDTVTASNPIRIEAGDQMTQEFNCEMDQIEAITLFVAAETADARVTVSIEERGKMIWSRLIAADEIINYVENDLALSPSLAVAKNKRHTLRVSGETGVMVFYSGNSRAAGKFDVAVQSSGTFQLNQEPIAGQLVLGIKGNEITTAHQYIIPVGIILGVIALAGIAILSTNNAYANKINRLVWTFKQYGFLLKQLVMRDFKVKYKASALGVLWSFLNPLLTMLVYYFVFSTLFQNNVANFPAYLITGIITFNYFSEATSLGMSSIVSNGGLITKVYIPKYIFPLSKILSSAINLCISMIPMMVIILLVGIPLQKSMLLMPIGMLFLMIFSFGMSLILATMNTFFRDTQFLWSVVITMWNFLTPIFYPESIIPEQYLSIYQMNPMYQIVSFIRSVMINGESPVPAAYFYCLVASMVSLSLGLFVFRKKQNQFVLHL